MLYCPRNRQDCFVNFVMTVNICYIHIVYIAQFEQLGYNGSEALSFARWLQKLPYAHAPEFGLPERYKPKWRDVEALPSEDGTSHVERIQLARTPLNTKQSIEADVRHSPVHPYLQPPGVPPAVLPNQNGSLVEALGGPSTMDDSAALKFWAEGGVRPIHPALMPQDVVQHCKQKMGGEFDEETATAEEKQVHADLMEGFKWFEVKKEEAGSDVAQVEHIQMPSTTHDSEDAMHMDTNEDQSADDAVNLAANEKAQVATAKKVAAAKHFAKGFLLPKNDRMRSQIGSKTSNSDSSDSSQGHSPNIASEEHGARKTVGERAGLKGSNGGAGEEHGRSADQNRKEKTRVRKFCKETQEYISVSEEAQSDDAPDQNQGSSNKPKKPSSSSKHGSDTSDTRGSNLGDPEAHGGAAADSKFDSDDFVSKMPGLPYSVDPTNGRDFERLIEYGGEQVSPCLLIPHATSHIWFLHVLSISILRGLSMY
jgi:hypothetical protein